MKIHYSYFLIIALLFVGLTSFSPDGPKKAEKGTYQIIINETKRQLAFTDQVLVTIEEKRQDHKNITISFSPTVDIYIPSRDEISSKDFKPLEEFRYN